MSLCGGDEKSKNERRTLAMNHCFYCGLISCAGIGQF